MHDFRILSLSCALILKLEVISKRTFNLSVIFIFAALFLFSKSKIFPRYVKFSPIAVDGIFSVSKINIDQVQFVRRCRYFSSF